ncbi:MAG: cell division protein FtsA, partial [Dehalococcoidia bacterium]
MLGPKTVASIDVGTTKVCTVLARLDWTEKLKILGVSSIPSKGLWKGEVVNVEEAARSIMKSVAEVQKTCGETVTSAYIGITGSHVTCVNNHNVVGISRNFRYFASGMVNRVLEKARDESTRPDTEVLHVIPRSYTLDGQRRPGNPYGVRGNSLEMETHVITGMIERINLLVRSVQEAGIQVRGLVIEPLASGEAVLTQEERELGVVLADIGGGSTDVATFTEGGIWNTSVLPVGGNHITGDLAAWLDIDFRKAEKIKVKYGHALPDEV